MTELFFESLSGVSRAIRRKEVSSVELTAMLLDRIKRVDPTLNAFIRVLADEAMERAEQLDRELSEGKARGLLHGVPIAIKDVFATRNSITTGGSKIFESWIPDKDAAVIERVQHAGAIIIGKNNLHEFCAGSTTENPHYGPARNPWNVNKIPAGSSGGSAVAVAAGLCYGAIGTDTTGSVRLPSSVCGIVGLKPTYDVISREGLIPLSWTFDHIGPLTRTVEDSAILFSEMVDPDKVGLIGVDLTFARKSLKGIAIGISQEYFFDDVEPEMRDIVLRAVEKLRELGAEVKEIRLSGVYEAVEAQKSIWKAEFYNFHQPMFEKHPDKYGQDLIIRLNAGKAVSANEYLNAQRYRRQFIRETLRTMSDCDMILSPTNVATAYDIGSLPIEKTIHNIFTMGKTAVASLLGFPALTVPCGFTSKKMPVGMQFIGKPYAEGTLLATGHVYEQSERWTSYLAENTAYYA